jgi:cell division septal protein FtsQ
MNKVSLMTEKGRKRRGHSRFIIFFILILLVLSGLSWVTYSGLRKASWLRIKSIAVAGNQNVSITTVQELLEGFNGENLIDVSTRDIKEKLYKVKRIYKARVIRQFPSTLKIKVFERQGYLYVKSSEGDLFPIDNRGMIMEYAVFPSKEDLPIIHTNYQNRQLHPGSFVKDAFVRKVIALQAKIALTRPEFLKYISEYYMDKDLIFIVDAKYGSRILIGTHDLDNQLRRYTFVQENGDINRKNIVDLRFANQVVVRPEAR